MALVLAAVAVGAAGLGLLAAGRTGEGTSLGVLGLGAFCLAYAILRAARWLGWRG